MNKSGRHTEIERLERSFWQSLVDDQPKVATGMLPQRSLMVSEHGAMSFDHAGYTKMANDPRHKLLEFAFSDMDVLFPTDDVAIASYRVHQKMQMDGKPMEMDAVDSSTWVKLDGAWKCAAHTESTAMPKQ